MTKKPSAVYEPGELDRVRGKLGTIDEAEAKRMAQLLGGEVGTEKNVVKPVPEKKKAPIRRENVDMVVGRGGRKPGRNVEVAGEEGEEKAGVFGAKKSDPADDPAIRLSTSYRERVKMDRYAAQFEFEIKNSMQAFLSMLHFFNEPEDYVNPRFVTRRMSLYYHKIEMLVGSTIRLLPRNNARRSERMKKTSPFVYSILDVIRSWDIGRIGSELSKIQGHPRSAKVSEFADMLRAVYKPLFILDKLDTYVQIKSAYKLLYKLICVDSPAEPKEKNQELIRTALASFADIRREVHYGLYPLLMKHISDRWFPYEQIFTARHRRFMAFLEVTENDQINPDNFNPDHTEVGNQNAKEDDSGEEQDGEDQNVEIEPDPNDPKEIERKEKAAAEEAGQKALDQSLKTLEKLFPQAGWERLPEFPDFYPYFSETYGLRRGYELLAPTDPLQQVAILMHILEDLCVAMRYVSFGTLTAPDGTHARITEAVGSIISHWRGYIDDSFSKEYLPRLNEYCRLLEHSVESRTSPFARRTLNELRWARRLYFLPYYKFESLGPPPFQKKDVSSIYSETRSFRKHLAGVAAGIEEGNRNGGAAARAICQGIENPWAPYNFEVPNPVSKRLDALLGPGKRNNAALIFFSLSAVTVLDYLLNNESSWAYADQSGFLFRSVRGDGVIPMFGVEDKLDADQIFKDVMKQKAAERQKAKKADG